MAENVDDQLAQLMSLGFDIGICKEALSQTGNVQAATEWILDRQRGQSKSPVLCLGQQPSNANPYVDNLETRGEARVTSRHDEQEAVRLREKSAKMALESKRAKRQDKEARNKILQEIKEDREYKKLIHGTSHASSERPRHEILESTPLQEEIKKQKRLDREARARALENIRQDRQAKRGSMDADAEADEAKRTASVSAAVAGTFPSTDSNRMSKALVQFRIKDGTTVRQTFNADATLQDMFAFVRTKDQSNQPLFFTVPFPRRVFAESEGNLTAQEAGFIPNVSLIVSHTNNQTLTSATPSSTASRAPSQPSQTSPMDLDDSNDSDDDHRLSFEDMNQDIQVPAPAPNLFNNQPAINPHRPATSTRRVPFGRRGRVGNPSWNWGTTGHRLTDEAPAQLGELLQGSNQQQQQSSINRSQVDENARRSALLSAIENRAGRQQESNDLQTHKGKPRTVQPLRDTCIEAVAGFLSQPTTDAQRRLRNLVFVSSKVGELLLARLEETRKLERFSLKRLAGHCYLQNVILDSYVYATDSLLEELGMCISASSITKLSLKGCDVITDAGIRHIEALRNLEYLDTSNCKVTDKGLQYLTKLLHLRYLNLSRTKVSDAGLSSLVQRAQFKEVLEAILLDGCTNIKSNDVLNLLNSSFSNLLHVSLASTGIQQQQAFSSRCNLQQLEILDMSKTGISDDEVVRIICCFKRLRELKLGGCGQVSARGLSFLPRELCHLETVQFPNRVQELDTVLARYADLPLRHLDLTSMLQITDEATKSIASMVSLRYLSLSGTRVTDEGVARLAGLVNLTKLFLDRTAVSDTGLAELIGLAKLDTLSLSRTQISNASLCLFGDFEKCAFARNLRTLNLAQCELVSDRGVKGLQGAVNLTNLNLDHTRVSKQCLRYLKDLEHLKPVRLLGIEREEAQDDDEV